jgi:hypothetical protein
MCRKNHSIYRLWYSLWFILPLGVLGCIPCREGGVTTILLASNWFVPPLHFHLTNELISPRLMPYCQSWPSDPPMFAHCQKNLPTKISPLYQTQIS